MKTVSRRLVIERERPASVAVAVPGERKLFQIVRRTAFQLRRFPLHALYRRQQ